MTRFKKLAYSKAIKIVDPRPCVKAYLGDQADEIYRKLKAGEDLTEDEERLVLRWYLGQGGD